MSAARPNCFLVGASKSGTTFVANALGRCPDVFVPLKKEFHYFATDLNCGGLRVESHDQYLRFFKAGGECRWRLDASPSYLYSAAAPGTIAAFDPGAKILVMLRDPVKRAYSMYLHNRMRGYETLEFEDALAAEEGRVREGWPWGFHYTRSGRYAAQVQRYLESFAPGNVRLIIAEELFSDTEAGLEGMFAWLGVRQGQGAPLGAANQTGSPRFPLLSRLISPQSGRLRRLAHVVPDWVLRARRRLIGWNIADAPPLDPRVAARLRALFEADVQRLAELIGRPLPWRASPSAAASGRRP